MKERPILFSSPMVKAILEGRKTQTRRVVKVQPPNRFQFAQDGTTGGVTAFWWTDRDLDLDDIAWWPGYDDQDAVKCPYGSPGDRLWVKETWAAWDSIDDREASEVSGNCESLVERGISRGHISYRADPQMHADKWRPSIFMPRWASRITLEITGVRVERLNEISEEDARAEGAERVVMPERGIIHNPLDHEDEFIASHKNGFQFIWECISGLDSWDSNPWVWVISFKRI